MTTLFGRPFLHRHFRRRAETADLSRKALSSDGRSFVALRSTPKARTYRTCQVGQSVIVKRFFDHGAFIAEVLIYELLNGQSIVPALRDVNFERTRLVTEQIQITRPAENAEDLKFLFGTLGLIHGSWEKAWRTGALVAAAEPYFCPRPSILSVQECAILQRFDDLACEGYPALSVGDVKLEHVLVSRNDRFLVDFDTAEIGRLDATDLVLGLSYCPRALANDPQRYIGVYDEMRAATGSRLGPLAGFAGDFHLLAEQCRSDITETVMTPKG